VAQWQKPTARFMELITSQVHRGSKRKMEGEGCFGSTCNHPPNQTVSYPNDHKLSTEYNVSTILRQIYDVTECYI
jgi:hypothetical protein